MPLLRLMHEVPLLNHLCKPGLCSCIFEVGINFKMRCFIYFKIKVLVLHFITAEVLAVVKLKVINKIRTANRCAGFTGKVVLHIPSFFELQSFVYK